MLALVTTNMHLALYLCSMLMLEDLEENEVLVCMNIVKIQGLQNHLPVSKMFVSLGRTSFQHPHFNYLVSDRGVVHTAEVEYLNVSSISFMHTNKKKIAGTNSKTCIVKSLCIVNFILLCLTEKF